MTKKLQDKTGYWRIEQMMEQAQGRKGLGSSFVYVGARSMQAECRDDDCKALDSKWRDDGYGVDAEITIRFRPNFGNRKVWFQIALDGNDTYSFYVYQVIIRKGNMKVEKWLEMKDVYAEMLCDLIEEKYDMFIEQKLGGFIPLR